MLYAMHIYTDSTSNVMESARSTDALTGHKTDKQTMTRRACKLGLLFIGFLVSSLDVITDWYNYWDATGRITTSQMSVEHYTAVNLFMAVFLGICIFSSFTWIVLVSSLIIHCHSNCRRHKSASWLGFFEEMVSLLSLALHNVPMLMLLSTAISVRFCPLVLQMRSIPGQVALVSTAIGVLFKIAHAIAFGCRMQGKREPHHINRYVLICLIAIVRILKTVLLVVASTLLFFILLVAFVPNPNDVSWLKTILHGVDLSGSPNGPIYIYQKYDLPYTVNRYIETSRTNRILPPAENFEAWSALKSRGRTDVECDHYVRRIHIGDSLELIEAGNKGTSTTYLCNEVNPFFKTSLPKELQTLLINHTCYQTFTMVYDVDAVRLTYKSDISLRPSSSISSDEDSCYEDSLMVNDESHMASVILGWPSSVLTSLKNYECEHSYECSTHLSPLFDPYQKPYFSCLGDVCDTSTRPITRKPQLREALHQFSYSPYTFLPTVTSYFPCLTTTTVERRVSAGLCHGTPVILRERRQTDTSLTSPQILSCPESPFVNTNS